MTGSALEQILAQRQAGSRDVVNVDEPQLKLVIFELAGEAWAFPGAGVREILAHVEIFPVPGCPPSLEGVINVRGDIESVIRLNELLQLPPLGEGTPPCILLGRSSGMSSGIRVDRVLDVTDVLESNIQPAPGVLPEQQRHLVTGVLQFRGRPVTLLDLERVFADYARGLG